MKKILLFPFLLACALSVGCGKKEYEKTYIPPTDTDAQNSYTTSESRSDSLSGGTVSDTASTDSGSKNDKEDIYDTAPIAQAYISGDTSRLDEIQSVILEKASTVISEYTSDDMDDYHKELALHDWIIRYCTYDKGELRAIPSPGKHAADPYGVLVDGQAICMGYTTTFKLFMDMLEIPCGIVHSCDDEGDEHAWNTVCLDGGWYYVDTTWDDPVPDYDERNIKHQYFNVTREEMEIQHVIPDGSPDTDSGSYLFASQNVTDVTDRSQITDAVKKAHENGHSDIALFFGSQVDLSKAMMSAGKDNYTFADRDLESEVTSGIRDAGFSYRYCTLRKCSQGTALLVNFGE